jgi:hypothetical protein
MDLVGAGGYRTAYLVDRDIAGLDHTGGHCGLNSVLHT